MISFQEYSDSGKSSSPIPESITGEYTLRGLESVLLIDTPPTEMVVNLVAARDPNRILGE